MKIRNPPGAQFEILVDGKPRSYRDIRGRCDCVCGVPQEPKPTQRSCGERLADWRGDRRSQGVGRLMPLTMRPAGLSSGIDQDRADYTVFCGEWNIGRIYEVRGGPEHLRWFWALHFPSKPESLRTDNRVATLEEAKAQFQKSWDAWKAWAKLEEVP